MSFFHKLLYTIYLDHELSDKKRRSFAAHLDSCQRCRKAINLLTSAEAHTSLIAEPDPYAIAPEFSWKNPKNNNIKTLNEFTLYAEDTLPDTWSYEGLGFSSGSLSIRGYYDDESPGALLGNHARIVEELFEGDTILGKGKIYLVACDIPEAMQNEHDKTFMTILACIPITGEDLAYYLELYVPRNADPALFLEHAKGFSSQNGSPLKISEHKDEL